ncbi:hypothetical protein GPECTOR_34g789 [Gonium pectorale]|uniref:Uncharacterized protein n=1 Tax=Gonium pectorale TaxID=33097 RepID=A0A150GE56_GONPE|nr:hypothetical protein GPECTOR_34g789 [Gonium pectorale]|eukprot:KXZ47630.1 hypothetical protein GPECTOR_34g789 [Gonium pectorale]
MAAPPSKDSTGNGHHSRTLYSEVPVQRSSAPSIRTALAAAYASLAHPGAAALAVQHINAVIGGQGSAVVADVVVPAAYMPGHRVGASEGGAAPGTEHHQGSLPASPPHATSLPRDSSAFRFDPAFLASHWQAVSAPGLPPGADPIFSAPCVQEAAGSGGAMHSTYVFASTPLHCSTGGFAEGPEVAERSSAPRLDGERSSRAAAAAAALMAGLRSPQPTVAGAGAHSRYRSVEPMVPGVPPPYVPSSPHRGGCSIERTSAGLMAGGTAPLSPRVADNDHAMQTLLSLGLVNAAAYHKARRRASEAGGSTPKAAGNSPSLNAVGNFIMPGPYLPPGASASPTHAQALAPARKQRRMSAIEVGCVRSQFNADEVFGVIRRGTSVAMPRDVIAQLGPSASGSPSHAAHTPQALPPSASMPSRAARDPGLAGGPGAALPPSASMPGRLR